MLSKQTLMRNNESHSYSTGLNVISWLSYRLPGSDDSANEFVGSAEDSRKKQLIAIFLAD